jgi:hypothetical protein
MLLSSYRSILARLCVFLALLWGAPANAAVVFDAVSSSSVTSNPGTTLSWTHTPSGTPTAVAVLVINYEGQCNITGITYGGTALTKANQVNVSAGPPNNNSVGVWGLANPPSGAQTVVITCSTTGGFTGGAAETVTGSDTTTCFSNSNGTDGAVATSTPSLVVNSASGELVVDALLTGDTFGILTPGGSQTKRFGEIDVPSQQFSGSSAPASAGSTTMSWTIGGGSTNYGITGASFKAAAGGATCPMTRSLMGIGC